MNTTDFLIKFEHLDWEIIQMGMEQKFHSNNNKFLRLVRISHTFTETAWCLKNHIGFILKGKMKIDFNGLIKEYKEGDGLWIEQGADSKHKVTFNKDEIVELILFEIKD